MDKGASLFPWRRRELFDWNICGMNHYYVDDVRFLFVALTKYELCITAEGLDDEHIWEQLAMKAKKVGLRSEN